MQNCATEPNEEEDILTIKKLHAQKENEWKKDKALLEQKVHLLELQLGDYRIREDNHRKLNETITAAINDTHHSTKQKVLAEFQKSIETQQQELQHARTKQFEEIQRLESQLRNANDIISERESQLKECELNYQRQYLQYDHRIGVLEQERQAHLQEVLRLREQIQRNDEAQKQREMQQRSQLETELRQLRENHFQESQLRQQDYEMKCQQLSQMYEKEKESLQQRINKCQNTIKKYQSHIEQNAEVQQLQSKFEEQVSQLKQELHEQQVQFQYEKKLLTKQIDELQKNQMSTSKKKSVELTRFRNSMPSADSPVQCKSFHIGSVDAKMMRQSQANQSIVVPKVNQSFERMPKQFNENLPIAFDELMNRKKMKSQSANSINQLNSYLQDSSIVQQKEDSFTDQNKQQTTRMQEPCEPQRRSLSQQGFKSSATNLSKILNENSFQKNSTTTSTQIKTNNTSFSHFKVPVFTQNQLNSIRNSSHLAQPCTTLRINDNHLNHIQAIKARYMNSEDMKTDTSYVKQNKENQLPTKSVHINNEIKFLIGKLLQAKGKLNNELESQKSFRYTKRFE